MPWTAKDAPRFTKKANTKEKREVWAREANSSLDNGESDGVAVRKANKAVLNMSMAHPVK